MSAIVSNYTASTIVRDFHKTHHYNFKFESVSSTFRPTHEDYMESLIQLALPAAVVGVILFLFYLVRFSCCRALRGTKESRVSCEPRNLKASALITAVLACGAIAVLFYGNEQVDEGIHHFESQTVKATTTYDKVMTSCAQLSMLSLGLSQAIGSVPYGNKTQLKNETVSELVQAGAELSTIHIYGKDNYNVAVANDEIDDGNDGRSIGTLVLAGLLLLSTILYVLAIAFSSFRLMRFVLWTLLFLFLFAAISCGAEFSLSVGTSDYCIDANANTEYYAESATNDEIPGYYINCSPDVEGPFDKYVLQITQSIGAAGNLMDEATASGVPISTEIWQQYLQLNTSWLGVQPGLTCIPIHMEYVSTVDTFCTDVLQGTAILFFCHLFAGVLIIIMLELGIRVLVLFSDRQGYYVVESHELSNESAYAGDVSKQPLLYDANGASQTSYGSARF